MQLFKLSSLILVFVLIFSSCQDDPTSLGKDLIGDQLEILVIDSDSNSLSQYSSSFVYDSLSFGATDRLLLGSLDYVKSTMLMRYGLILPDSISTSLKEGNLTVLNAEVELRPSYKIGDQSRMLNFTVHEITSEWGSRDFDADSLAMLTYNPDEITDNKEITDSLIKFNVNSTVALEWLNSLRGDTLANNNGMIFLPSAGNNLIYGFRAYPNVSFDNSPFMRFVVQNENNIIDTLIARLVFDVHLPEGTVPAVSEDKIQLTAGLGERGKLHFDLSKVPLNVNINRAELTLKVDSLSSLIGSPDTDSLRVHMFADSTDFTINGNQRALRLYFDGKEFKGDITNFVQVISSGSENQGFQLSLSNELDAVGRYVIYGSKFADRTLRPKLVIYYNVFD